MTKNQKPKATTSTHKQTSSMLVSSLRDMDRDPSSDESVGTKYKKDVSHMNRFGGRWVSDMASNEKDDTESVATAKLAIRDRFEEMVSKLQVDKAILDNAEKELDDAAKKWAEENLNKPKTPPGPKLPTQKNRKKAPAIAGSSPVKKRKVGSHQKSEMKHAFGDILQLVRTHAEQTIMNRVIRNAEDDNDQPVQTPSMRIFRRQLGHELDGLHGKAYSEKLIDIKRKCKERDATEEAAKKKVRDDAHEVRAMAAAENRRFSQIPLASAQKELDAYFKAQTDADVAHPPGPKDIVESASEMAQLQFIPKRKAPKKGYHFPSYFNGKTADEKLMENYTRAWVHDVFHPRFVHMVEQFPRQWFKVPIGTRQLAPGEAMPEGWPKIKYRQGNQDTCVFNSMASALWFIGKTVAANALYCLGAGTQNLSGPQMLDALLKAMKEHAPEIARAEKWKPKSLKLATYDPVKNTSPHPTLLQLLGKDGGTQHAVTTVDNWIFDSVEERALPLTQENLSHCCGTVLGFDRVYAAYRFEQRETR